jgi:hypothetical protein
MEGVIHRDGPAGREKPGTLEGDGASPSPFFSLPRNKTVTRPR